MRMHQVGAVLSGVGCFTALVLGWATWTSSNEAIAQNKGEPAQKPDGKKASATENTEKAPLPAKESELSVAADYARKVMSGAEVVVQKYFKKVTHSQLVDTAIRGMYKKLDEPLPSTVKDKLDKVKKMEKADLVALLTEARQHVGKRDDLAGGKDVTLSLMLMMRELDPQSDYVAVTELQSDMQGNRVGIGVQIRKSSTRDQLEVGTVINGGPAYKAKIYAGDLITTIIREVDGGGNPLPKPETISTKGMTPEEAVKKILGRPGTKIKLLVERKGVALPLEFHLLRGKVEVESVVGHTRTADDSWNYVIDAENQVCYVRLTSFSSSTQGDLLQVMKKLSNAGMKGFILDLRFNLGGLLASPVKISDMFIDNGLIVTIRPRRGAETSYIGSKRGGSYLNFPMVCLVNGQSAGASEIVAACLRDHGRAVIMGSRSSGTAGVQTILPFSEPGGYLKLTTATFWRPSGKNLNKADTQGREEDVWGVTPDKSYILNLPTKEIYELRDRQRDVEIIRRSDRPAANAAAKTAFRDRQLQMALDYLRGRIRTAATGEPTKKGN
jgi:carboxyl-terminal processing protease